MCFVGPAQAAPETVAGFGTGAGQVSEPVGVAVDESTGDLYVADRNNFRVDKFDSQGHFLFALGYGVADGLTEEFQTCGPEATPPTESCFAPNLSSSLVAESVAVDPVTENVYVGDRTHSRIVKFSSSGAFIFMVGANVNKTKVAEGGATQAEKNICTAASADTCGNGEYGTGPNEFTNSFAPISIDSAGNVWVGDLERLASFDPAGAPAPEIALPGAGRTRSLDLDPSDNFYVLSEGFPGIRKLEAGTGNLLGTFDAGGQPRAVSLDPGGKIYVGDATSPYRFKVYAPGGEQTSQFGAGQVIGAPGDHPVFGGNAIAIDPVTERLYAASTRPDEAESVVQAFRLPEPGPLLENQHVEDLLPTTVTLAAALNPEGQETTYRFEWGTSESYGQTTTAKTLSGTGFESEDVDAQLEQLIPGTTYHFRLVAVNHCNPSEPAAECTVVGPDTAFTTPPAITIGPQWATEITAHSATLHAELDPLGVEAEAWVEYGTTEGYGHLVTLANLGGGFGPVARAAFITGLQSATTYHYRFVARDQRDGVTYTVPGLDHTFITQFGGLGFELADGRVWEMVSPSDKHGGRLTGGGEIHLQASANGNSLAFPSKLPVEDNPEGSRAPERLMSLARRNADGSWSSEAITSPNTTVSGVAPGVGTEFKLFNSNLSEALVEPRSDTLLSSEASERTPYLRENTNPPVFSPLVTGREPYANVPSSIEFDSGKKLVPSVSVVGASPDFQHFALLSEVPLVQGASVSGETVYEWSNGQIKPVSVLPAGEGGALVEAHQVGSGRGSVRGAISDDGSRVFWSSGGFPDLSALYVRDTQTEETVRLDVVRGGSGGGPVRPIFQGASADGSVVFFTDSQQLTGDASPKGSDLYRCELSPGSVASGCEALIDVSVPVESGENAQVEGITQGITDDARGIYFVARGVLDDAPSQTGDSAVAGEPNMYLWRQGQGVRFVATLGTEDRTDWGKRQPSSEGESAQLSAAASPSGRYLGFMSRQSLTGYDNRDSNTQELAQEVFRYDAFADQLECVSCNPSGVRPRSTTASLTESLVNPTGLWAGQRIAATLPSATSINLGGVSLYRPRSVLDSGRIFFNAVDSLVPADSNGQWDVYQYEPTGAGNCLTSSGGASITSSAQGCISLLSSGTAEEEAAFFDASETGDDAFFFTPARLSVLDEDNEIDIYDARVDGIPATLPANTECLGEACQPLAQAPNDPTPASASFKGAGNVHSRARKRCPKEKRQVRRHSRARCVKKKHRAGSGHGKQRKANSTGQVAR
jgi:DNA-binding beta-propeller fold protein YncE